MPVTKLSDNTHTATHDLPNKLENCVQPFWQRQQHFKLHWPRPAACPRPAFSHFLLRGSCLSQPLPACLPVCLLLLLLLLSRLWAIVDLIFVQFLAYCTNLSQASRATCGLRHMPHQYYELSCGMRPRCRLVPELSCSKSLQLNEACNMKRKRND